MGGWQTAAIVRRYVHLSSAHLAHHARVLDGPVDTNPAQQPQADRFVFRGLAAKARIEPATHEFLERALRSDVLPCLAGDGGAGEALRRV